MKVPMPRTLALTGATGFIGAALLKRLLVAGWAVNALCRSVPPHRRADHGDSGLRWFQGSLEDPESLKRLVAGVTAVVHCAGAVRGASAAQFNQVNVEGVARLVQAARELHPLPRFLLISSLAAREPQLSAYGASKRGGEDVLRSGASGIMWSALRPPAVYGPGDRETLPLVRCMQHGWAPVLGPLASRFSLLYVDDLADAVRHFLEMADWPTGPFEIHDGRPGGYAWQDLIRTVSRSIRKPVRQLRVPRGLLHIAACINLSGARVFGYRPMLTPGKVRELTHADWVCDDASLRAATGWKPRVLLEDGMRRTLQCLQDGRWITEA
jgi:nucleoside-diphosphate-sugar epimerase